MKERLERAYQAVDESRAALAQAAKEAADLADDADPDAVNNAESAFDELTKELERSEKRLEFEKRIAEARATADPLLAAVAADTWVKPKRLSVRKEEMTYRPDRPYSFFSDLVYSVRHGDEDARVRLARHGEETRDLTTTATAGGGFVPPLYLGDLWAEFPRQGRPFADAVPTRPLPGLGMNITLPRVTTAPAAAVQATENSNLQETDLVEATITTEVRTIGGIQDVSMQLLERSDPSIDEVIFRSLRDSYDTILDTQMLSGSGSSGQHQGIRGVTGANAVTYTDGTPTAAELVPKVYDAIQQIASGRFRPADVIVMHPRRAAFLASNLSSTFPLFQLGSLMQAAGTQDNGLLTSFSGLRVVTDANIGTTFGAGTNEDEIYVLHTPDLYLYEGDLRAEVFRETLSGAGTVRLRLYGYSAWVSERQPESIAVISGTGLVTPAF